MRRLASVVLLPLALALVACGGPDPQAPAADSGGYLEASFAQAARDYRVPVELLKAISWVESRFFMRPGEPTLDNGYGLMHLADNDQDRSLPLAMELTGLSREELVQDPAANIRGAAAVLRWRADQVFAQYPALRETELADWYDVVTRQTGYADVRVAEDYANRVFYTVANGCARTLPDGERVRLVATPVDLAGKRAYGETQQFSGTDGYPGARWVSANSGNYTSGRDGNPINYVIIHTTQGSYNGAVSWFQNGSANVSAHYIISQGGDITQMVHHRDTGWHAGNWTYNQQSIGIEHEGFVSDPSWVTPAMQSTSAALTRWLCDGNGIPKDRNHIIGHNEVPRATHTDPGQYWNWSQFMGLVQNGSSTPSPSTGTLRGVVFVDPDPNNRIAGASVRLSTGPTTQTDGNGAFSFDLEPGDYTVEASRGGYVTASVQRHVSAGQEIWGSVGLRPQTQNGVYRGAIYELRADDPCRADSNVTCDMGTRIDGATVTLTDGGRTITFTSGMNNEQSEVVGQGRVWVEVPAGRWTATASKAGFETNSTARDIVAGQETWGSVGLLRTGAATDTTAPVVTIESPVDGSTITDLAELEVRGAVTDASLPAGVKVNGADVPLTNGRFQTAITLRSGANRITVDATDTAGNTGSAAVSVTYQPPAGGIDGFVFHAPDEATRIAGAKVEFGQGGSVVDSVETGADGAYRMDLPAGDYVVTVSAGGYQDHAETVTVVEGQRADLRIGLYPGEDVDDFISITSPSDGATVGTSQLTVIGMTSLYGGELTVNGVAAQVGAEGGRDQSGFSFSATVTLVAGENVLEAVASKDGVTVRDSITVTYLEGAGASTAEEPGSSGGGKAEGGCSAAGGSHAGLFALLAVLGVVLRRRRR